MRIKKFRAKNMLEALRKVKMEFGEEAVILDSGKVFEEGETFYEVVAAIEEPEMEVSAPSQEKQESFQGQRQEDNITLTYLIKEITEIKEILKELALKKNSSPKSLEFIREGIPEEIALNIESSGAGLIQFIKEALREKGVCPLSKVQVFIGEPGVGKTTALFKVAFWYKLQKKGKIAVFSMDNYKIGGREQAQRLASLLEIPYYQSDWEDFQSQYKQVSPNFDFIFIDTPSLTKRFGAEELKEIFNLYPFLRFIWVVRSTEQYIHLSKVWDEIKELPIDSLILTFIDRVIKGSMLFWILRKDFPFPSFLSNGDRIPEDIIKSDEKILIDILLKGIKKNFL